MTAGARGPCLSVGDVVPTGSVRAADGKTILLRQSPHRAIILVFVHPGGCHDCRAYISGLDEQAARFRRWSAAVVILVDESSDDALTDSVGGRVVVDDTMRARCGIPDDHVAVVVVDRHGQVWESATEQDHRQLPAAEELEQDVRFIAIQCPECDVPDVPGLGEWEATE